MNLPNNATYTSTLTVGDSYSIQDLNVRVSLTHERAEDLDVFLIAPDGTRIELFTDVGGGSGQGFNDTVLDDEAATSVTAGSAPFAGSCRPEGDLSILDGMNISGTWTLEVADDRTGKTGTLNSWSIIVEHFE